MKYSKETGCFYPEELDYSGLPSDVVDVFDGEFEKALSREAGETFEVVEGMVKIIPAQPTPAHDWDAKKWQWVLNPVKQKSLVVDQIAAARAAKIVEIGDVAQFFVDNLVKDTAPEFERATYPAQQDDALAWLADSKAPTPTLDAIAKARGVPVEILRKKAADKVVAYRALAASVVGQRQAFEDKVNAAKTLSDIEAIVPVYKAGAA